LGKKFPKPRVSKKRTPVLPSLKERSLVKMGNLIKENWAKRKFLNFGKFK